MRHYRDEEMIGIPEYLSLARSKVQETVCLDGTWHPAAWEELYEIMCDEGLAASELSPYAAATYACAAEVAVEYLGRHPSTERFQLLERRLSFDIHAVATMMQKFDGMINGTISDDQRQRQLAALFEAFPFEYGEYELLATSISKCVESYRTIERMCPDT